MVAAIDYRCLSCGTEIDETEFGDVRDADICGYCLAAKMNEVRQRRGPDGFASGLNECGRHREIAMQADVEIRLDRARDRGDDIAIEIYEQILRLIES